MRVICVGGIPGSGKTHLVKTMYPTLPCLDMSILRKRAETNCPRGTSSYNIWLQSMRDLADALEQLEQAGTTTIVVEGIFWPGSKSLQMLHNECMINEWPLEEVHLEVPANVAVRRVLEDYEKDLDEQRFFGRLFLIGKYLGGFK